MYVRIWPFLAELAFQLGHVPKIKYTFSFQHRPTDCYHSPSYITPRVQSTGKEVYLHIVYFEPYIFVVFIIMKRCYIRTSTFSVQLAWYNFKVSHSRHVCNRNKRCSIHNTQALAFTRCQYQNSHGWLWYFISLPPTDSNKQLSRAVAILLFYFLRKH